MVSDQILAIMALMRELERPTKVYNKALRKAWRTATDSAPYNAAVARGNDTLLEIEKIIRAWVEKHPDHGDTSASSELYRVNIHLRRVGITLNGAEGVCKLVEEFETLADEVNALSAKPAPHLDKDAEIQRLQDEVQRLQNRVDKVERAYIFDTADLKRQIAKLTEKTA